MFADMDFTNLYGGWRNTVGVIILVWIAASFLYYQFGRDDGGPPQLGETIPFLSNTIAVVRDPLAFWDRTL